MDPIKPATPVTKDDEQPSRPWVRAMFSGAVFGTLGAAALNWLGLHSLPVADRSKPSFGRNWMTAIGGVAAGTVAIYGTLRADNEPPKSVYSPPHSDVPETKISADSVALERTVQSPGERSL